MSNYVDPFPSLIRSTRNPSKGYFSADEAEHVVSQRTERRCNPHTMVDECHLDLSGYVTTSVEAIRVLSRCQWVFIDFGLGDLSTEVARAIDCLDVLFLRFTHLQDLSHQALAELGKSGHCVKVDFANIESISPRGLQQYAALMQQNNGIGGISFWGDFIVDTQLAVSLVNLPNDHVNLLPEQRVDALTVDAWNIIAEARNRDLTVMSWDKSPDEAAHYELLLYACNTARAMQ